MLETQKSMLKSKYFRNRYTKRPRGKLGEREGLVSQSCLNYFSLPGPRQGRNLELSCLASLCGCSRHSSVALVVKKKRKRKKNHHNLLQERQVSSVVTVEITESRLKIYTNAINERSHVSCKGFSTICPPTE